MFFSSSQTLSFPRTLVNIPFFSRNHHSSPSFSPSRTYFTYLFCPAPINEFSGKSTEFTEEITLFFQFGINISMSFFSPDSLLVSFPFSLRMRIFFFFFYLTFFFFSYISCFILYCPFIIISSLFHFFIAFLIISHLIPHLSLLFLCLFHHFINLCYFRLIYLLFWLIFNLIYGGVVFSTYYLICSWYNSTYFYSFISTFIHSNLSLHS